MEEEKTSKMLCQRVMNHHRVKNNDCPITLRIKTMQTCGVEEIENHEVLMSTKLRSLEKKGEL